MSSIWPKNGQYSFDDPMYSYTGMKALEVVTHREGRKTSRVHCSSAVAEILR